MSQLVIPGFGANRQEDICIDDGMDEKFTCAGGVIPQSIAVPTANGMFGILYCTVTVNDFKQTAICSFNSSI